jgi:hypothetical protein
LCSTHHGMFVGAGVLVGRAQVKEPNVVAPSGGMARSLQAPQLDARGMLNAWSS